MRIGFKGRKKPPTIVYRYGNQDKQIAKFLTNREFILGFLKDAESNEVEKKQRSKAFLIEIERSCRDSLDCKPVYALR